MQGIDASRFQSTLNWATAKSQGIDFAFVKATEGVDFIDVSFVNHMNNAIAAGVLIGPYHFARPDRDVFNGSLQDLQLYTNAVPESSSLFIALLAATACIASPRFARR